MAEVLIVSGGGAYLDPWHPFAETSARLAEMITSYGHRVELSDEVEKALLGLRSRSLVVLNVGNPDPPRPRPIMIAVQQALLGHLVGGGGLLGMHVSATSFTTMPRWPEILGGRWVRGTTMHPPLDLAQIHLATGCHPIVGELSEIEVLDERYSHLDVRADVTVLGEHSLAGTVHPIIWAHAHGPGRVVYDGLGHDARSYDSATHRALLGRAVAWMLGDRA